MRVKCPRCGYEFEVSVSEVGIKPMASDIAAEILYPSWFTLESFSRCGPYKMAYLSCGHVFHYEFSVHRKGDKIYCRKCRRTVEIVKLIDTVTSEEHVEL